MTVFLLCIWINYQQDNYYFKKVAIVIIYVYLVCMESKKYVRTKVVVIPGGTAKIRESAFESTNHSTVWELQRKTLGFYDHKDAEYFVKYWKGQHDYKEALPKKDMEFVVYFENFHGKIAEDVIFKSKDWEPYYLH